MQRPLYGDKVIILFGFFIGEEKMPNHSVHRVICENWAQKASNIITSLWFGDFRLIEGLSLFCQEKIRSAQWEGNQCMGIVI